MSEIAPRKVRGAIVSGYQFCITIGLLLASCVCYATQNRTDTGSYRIPIAIQFLWALILGIGLFLLPESPRWYVKRGRVDDATRSLSRIRGQPAESAYIQEELAEIIANCEYEQEVIPTGSYFSSWAACFTGGLRNPASNLRRTILGTSLQMMQQWTGVNFIFYFGTTFFQSLGTISNPFLISLITTLVNVCSTPLSFWTIERFGRRPLLIWGALGMLICEFITGIIGVTKGSDPSAVKAQISFSASTSSSSPRPGVPAPGSASARSSLSRSALAVSPSRPPPTGSGTASSPSSPLTWSAPTRATLAPRSSSSGDPPVSSASSTPTSSSGRPRVLPSSRWTA
jgi:SP family sugar:H+ symporter-like MFS transporter